MRLPKENKLYWQNQLKELEFNLVDNYPAAWRVEFGKRDSRGAFHITIFNKLNEFVRNIYSFDTSKELLAFAHGYNQAIRG